MLETPIIDVAIGLIFFYVVLSLVCSAIQEVIASVFAFRSHNLKKGIENLVGNEYAQKMYSHPLIEGLHGPPNWFSRKFSQGRPRPPSYINPETFATALIHMVARDSETGVVPEELRDSIDKIEVTKLRDLLLSLADKGEAKVDAFKKRLAKWFDESMDRVSGWYKRQAMYCLLVIAAVVTIAVNADSIRIVEQLWLDDELRTAIVAEAERVVGNGDDTGDDGALQAKIDALKQIEAFPIGHPGDLLATIKAIRFQTVVGWILTIAAISLGAPFWFDLLGKIVRLRGSGTKEPSKEA